MSSEKSIILHANEVRRLLAGKSVDVRREMRSQPDVVRDGIAWVRGTTSKPYVIGGDFGREPPNPIRCHFGAPGDQRWVRETLQRDEEGVWSYAADEMTVTLPKDDPYVPAMLSWAHHKEGDVCAANHMPRWASRLTVTITAVHCERSADGRRWEWAVTMRQVCPCEGEQVDPGPHITGCRWSGPAHDEGSPL